MLQLLGPTSWRRVWTQGRNNSVLAPHSANWTQSSVEPSPSSQPSPPTGKQTEELLAHVVLGVKLQEARRDYLTTTVDSGRLTLKAPGDTESFSSPHISSSAQQHHPPPCCARGRSQGFRF